MARGDGEDRPKKGGPPPKFEGLRAGTTILKEDPFACILFSRYRKVRCDTCFRKFVFLFREKAKIETSFK